MCFTFRGGFLAAQPFNLILTFKLGLCFMHTSLMGYHFVYTTASWLTLMILSQFFWMAAIDFNGRWRPYFFITHTAMFSVLLKRESWLKACLKGNFKLYLIITFKINVIYVWKKNVPVHNNSWPIGLSLPCKMPLPVTVDNSVILSSLMMNMSPFFWISSKKTLISHLQKFGHLVGDGTDGHNNTPLPRGKNGSNL